jgi:hypothetical protein
LRLERFSLGDNKIIKASTALGDTTHSPICDMSFHPYCCR